MLKKLLKLNTDFKTLLEDNTKNLDVVGLNYVKGRSFLKFGFVWLVFIVGCYGNISAILYTNMELRQIIINICHLVGIFMVSFRYFHILLDQESFKSLMDHAILSTSQFSFSKELELSLSKKYSRISRLVQLWLYVIYRVIVVTNATLPMIFIKWFMMSPILLPGIDIRSHPGYEIVLLFYVIFYYYLYYAFHVYDSYFYFYAFVIMMRTNLFCELAAEIGDLDSNSNTQSKQMKLVYQLCVLHEDVSRFSVKFSKTFSVIALGTGLVSLFCLTVALYIRNVDPMYAFTLVSVTTSQFLLLCIFGELLLQQSNKMASVLYCSKWYNVEHEESRKIIPLLILRSQAHSRLSAYGLYDLSMETFSKFLQNAYSFYALLRNMS